MVTRSAASTESTQLTPTATISSSPAVIPKASSAVRRPWSGRRRRSSTARPAPRRACTSAAAPPPPPGTGIVSSASTSAPASARISSRGRCQSRSSRRSARSRRGTPIRRPVPRRRGRRTPRPSAAPPDARRGVRGLPGQSHRSPQQHFGLRAVQAQLLEALERRLVGRGDRDLGARPEVLGVRGGDRRRVVRQQPGRPQLRAEVVTVCLQQGREPAVEHHRSAAPADPPGSSCCVVMGWPAVVMGRPPSRTDGRSDPRARRRASAEVLPRCPAQQPHQQQCDHGDEQTIITATKP